MILVDTSVWVNHLRSGDTQLIAALQAGAVLGHPFVLGELALGSLRNREAVIDALRGLPPAHQASDDEVLSLIGQRSLYGLGIGYIDAHLLASTLLTPGTRLWTRDRRLLAAAERLEIAP